LALTDPSSALLVRGQLAYLHRRGFDVHLVTGPGEPAAALAAAELATHHAVPIERDVSPRSDAIAVAALIGLLRRLRPTLVDGSTPKAGLLSMVAATVARVPTRIHTLRGLRLETSRGARRIALWSGHRVTCDLAHRVVCVGPSLRTRAIEMGVVRAERAIVLGPGSGNGVDPEAFQRAVHVDAGARLRRDHGISPAATVVAFVGRLTRDKGVGDLVAAWQRRLTTTAHLLIVGPDDPTDPIDHATRVIVGRDPSIHVLGDHRAVGAVYAASDVVVLPSLREGLANVLLEAAAMGCALVATRIPGCIDVVADGVTGTLVPPRDVRSIAAAIDRYAADARLRASHGAAAQAYVGQHFRMTDVWTRVADHYQQLIDQRD
jgi:glycosyltransferase involved in cell wall biosynthesis